MATQTYEEAIASLAERLAPGGELEQSLLSSVDKQTTMLANSMEGANISRGLGNATLGVAPTASRVGMEQKESVRNNLLGQYLSTLQYLANYSLQRTAQNAQIYGTNTSGLSANAQQGLDVFGKPLRGSLAEAELLMAQKSMGAAANPTAASPTASSYPSLYSSGGGIDFDFGQNPFGSTGNNYAPTSASEIKWGTPIYGAVGYEGF